jgi:carbonic anhydrase
MKQDDDVGAGAGADAELIFQALRFFFWAAGQGISPVDGEDAAEPEECLWQYGLRTGDEHWETVAERYRATAQSSAPIEGERPQPIEERVS